jgi:glyoxylase-like metal-dependent hydrolase (beta-lactamase superfamily II)
MNPIVKSFFDNATATFTYVVYEKEGSSCSVIDSVLHFDQKSGRTNTSSVEPVIAFIESMKLRVEWILETHAHADHLSAAQLIRTQLGGKVAMSQHIQQVQTTFKDIFNLEGSFVPDGSQFDYLIQDGEQLVCGNLILQCFGVPGHTHACMAYQCGDSIFVGDTLFPADVGTARCDFPGGDAHSLYRSIKRILSFPDETKLYMCHDYPPSSREVQCFTTVALQRKGNIHIHDGVSEEEFVNMRKTRDATLDMPTLILPSIQINIRAGHFPPKESNQVSYLKLPLNIL